MSHLHLSWGMPVVLGGVVGRDLQGTPTLHFSEPQFLHTFSDR